MSDELSANNKHETDSPDETDGPPDDQMDESKAVTIRMDNPEALPLKGTDNVDGYNRQGSKTFELKDCLNFCGGLACFGALAGVGGMLTVFDFVLY